MPAKILIFSANPADTPRVEVGEEARSIRETIAATALRDSFAVENAPATRVADFQTYLLRTWPAIVHFAGHGARGGAADTRGSLGADDAAPSPGTLLVHDERGRAFAVKPEALAQLFKLLRGVRCVVLNACFSEAQAEALKEHVDYVIGTTAALPDAAAIVFSKAFYQALGEGQPLKAAFKLGQTAVRLAHVDPAILRDFHRADVKPEEIFLAERRAAPFTIPFPHNPLFFGRNADLDRLHLLLQEQQPGRGRPVMLTGMGGIGKTQLAVEYAHAHRADYPGGVYWINAARGDDGRDDWRKEIVGLAVKLDLEAKDAPEGERQLRLIAVLSACLQERPEALVIFDNVDNPANMLTDRCAGLVPASLGCRVLFTTQRRDAGPLFASVEVLELPVEAAVKLLLSSDKRRALWERREAPDAAEEIAAARDICGSLGRLPLAVVLAAAFLGKNPKITLAVYRKRIDKYGALPATDTNKIQRNALVTLHEASVQATLASQWAALESNDARRALQTAALLGEAATIPLARLALLTGLAGEAEEGFAAPLDDALGELAGLSLVEMLAGEAIRLHPLVRAFAQTRIEGREAFAAACAERLANALRDMGRLHEEVAGRGVDAVLGDLRIGSKLAGPPGQARLEALLRPLDRESHVLRGWDPAKEPGFLLQQLHNRCLDLGIEEVRERAEAKLEEQRWPWLRERIRTSRESEALVRTLEGHSEGVSGVAVTTDGRFAVSASSDKTLRVWDLGTGQALRTLEGHTNWVYGVAVTADGRFAVSASGDETLKVWDLGTGQPLMSLESHAPLKCCTITPDGKILLAGDEAGALHILDWRNAPRHLS